MLKTMDFYPSQQKMPKRVSSKYGQKLLDSTKKVATDALRTASKRAIQKTVEATGDLVSNEIPENITKFASKCTSEHASKLPAQTGKTSVQPIAILKENYI